MINKDQLYKRYAEWLEEICATEQPDKKIIAYNIGLFEREQGYLVYLIGSKHFNAQDSDWAYKDDFVPGNNSFAIDGLNDENWQDIQKTIEEFTKHFLDDPEHKDCFLARAQVVAVGFDDGDLTIVFQKK